MTKAQAQTRIDLHVDSLLGDIERARELFEIVVLDGGKEIEGEFHPYDQPTRRDLTQYLFLEVAASWEHFTREVFFIAVQHFYATSPQKVEYLAGHIDRGQDGVYGWASPDRLVERSTHLLGKNSEIARMKSIPNGQQIYDRLAWSHKIRNRIAHVGPSVKYNRILSPMGVPAPKRQGLGPGRLLLDYPAGSPIGDRWFDRLLDNYQRVAVRWQEELLA